MASSCRMLCIQGHPKRKTLSNIGEDEVGKEGFFPHQPFDHYSFGLFDKQCLELMPLILFDISEVFDLMIPLCAFAVQRSSAVWYTTCWSSFFLSPKIVVFVFPSQAATRLAQLVKLRDEFRRRAIMAMKAGREWDHWITAVAQDEVLHIDSRVWCVYIILYIYIFIIILYIYIYTYVCANIVSECLWLDGLAIRRFCGFDPCRLIHSAVRRLLTLCPGGCGVELERQRRHKTRQSRNTTEVWEWCWCTCPFYVFIGAAKGEKQPF